MSDNKDLNSLENGLTSDNVTDGDTVELFSDEVSSEEAASSQTVSQEEGLEKELEEIRDIFQQELDKASAESEAQVGGEDSDEPDSGSIDEENLCLCCGEKEKMEGSDYCEDCHEAMRRYPFKWIYFLVAALAVYAAVLAVGKIADINRGWVYDYEGRVLSEAGWYSDANDKFQYSQNYLYRSKIEPKMVYMHNLENAYKQGGFEMINSYPVSVATLFDEWEVKLPYMKNVKRNYMRAQIMAATIQQVNEEVFSKYSETAQKDLPYEKIIKELSSYDSRMLHIGLDENGNEITETTTGSQDYNGTMTTSNEVYFKRTEKYDKAMLEYFKYYFASACERPYEERVDFLENVRKLEPDMLWLYAADLAIEYADNGEKEKALELADLIYNDSETNVVSYYVRNVVSRKYDKDFDAAIEYCNNGIELGDNYEFHRQLALNYLAKGDYKKAQQSAQDAYAMNGDWSTVNMLAFCALANGDKDKYKEMYEIFASYNKEREEGTQAASFSKSVLTLKDGKASVSEILEKGGYDIND